MFAWFDLVSNDNAQERINDGHAGATDTNTDLDRGQDGNGDKVPRGIDNINVSIEVDPYNTDDRSAVSWSQSFIRGRSGA